MCNNTMLNCCVCVCNDFTFIQHNHSMGANHLWTQIFTCPWLWPANICTRSMSVHYKPLVRSMSACNISNGCFESTTAMWSSPGLLAWAPAPLAPPQMTPLLTRKWHDLKGKRSRPTKRLICYLLKMSPQDNPLVSTPHSSPVCWMRNEPEEGLPLSLQVILTPVPWLHVSTLQAATRAEDGSQWLGTCLHQLSHWDCCEAMCSRMQLQWFDDCSPCHLWPHGRLLTATLIDQHGHQFEVPHASVAHPGPSPRRGYHQQL